MSYILDALKKAEQERRRGRTPDFLDDHGLRPQEPKKRDRLYLIIIAVVAVAGGFGWYYGHDSKQSEIKLPFQTDRAQTAINPAPQQQAPQKAQAPAPAVQQPIAAPSKPAATPFERIVDTKTPVKVAPKPVERAADKKEPVKTVPPKKVIKEQPAAQAKTEPTGTADVPKPDPNKVYTIAELPDTVRTGLPPAMSVSTHIYSTEPSERLVSVNGSIGREGREIFKGVTVDAITPEGVILKSQGYKFRVGLK
jgi:general secretion pathway protein B